MSNCLMCSASIPSACEGCGAVLPQTTDDIQLTALRIANWASSTFGPSTSRTIATRLLIEAAELAKEPTSRNEAADVLILLLQWCVESGCSFADLLRTVEAKHEINERRDWVMVEPGHWRHTEPRIEPDPDDEPDDSDGWPEEEEWKCR